MIVLAREHMYAFCYNNTTEVHSRNMHTALSSVVFDISERVVSNSKYDEFAYKITKILMLLLLTLLLTRSDIS